MTSPGRELKSISNRFRSLLSQAARSSNANARVDLRRLLQFVEATPILAAEIARAPKPEGNVMEIWQAARGSRLLPMPDDPLEELGLLHALLSALSRDGPEQFWQLCHGYRGGAKPDDVVANVLGELCPRYGNHLRDVLEQALLSSSDPAYDSRRVEVHVSGGTNQLNLAQDQARIDAQQTIGADLREILRVATDLATNARTAQRETQSPEAADLVEVTDAVVETVQSATPNRFMLRSAKDKLKSWAESVGAVASLADHVQTLAPQALHLASKIGDYLEHLIR